MHLATEFRLKKISRQYVQDAYMPEREWSITAPNTGQKIQNITSHCNVIELLNAYKILP